VTTPSHSESIPPGGRGKLKQFLQEVTKATADYIVKTFKELEENG